MKTHGSAVWSGGIKDGKGAISTKSGALKEYPYGFAARFEGKPGTNRLLIRAKRLKAADGLCRWGNPDPTSTHGETPAEAKEIELKAPSTSMPRRSLILPSARLCNTLIRSISVRFTAITVIGPVLPN